MNIETSIVLNGSAPMAHLRIIAILSVGAALHRRQHFEFVPSRYETVPRKPIHRPLPRSAFPGMVFKITPGELAAADRYEVAEYMRVQQPDTVTH
ncbi:MAG: hypothetical protein WBF89_02330, partial [Steroidobacteraceae bacterium]